jgi:hypothetical protein
VQTTLLGLAIAIILAIVSALVAPLVVDWNHYRAPIEAEASRLTGLSVRVNGAIDARLLPTPDITLRDVEVGGTGQPPQLRAGMLKLELALGPLLRGQVQATQVRLIAPQLRVALDRSGAVELPVVSPSFRPEALSISRFNVEDGSITLADAASGARLILQKLWFNGDVTSFAGSFSGEGAAVVGDALYGYRITGSPADGGGIKIRLGVDPSERPLTTDFDGKLTFAHGVPQFEGTLALSRPVGATLANGQRVVSEPWRAVGAIHATPASASLRSLAFRYGPEERAVDFTGSADLSFGANPHLAGKISAMQVDVDRALADPDVTDRPPLVVLRSFLQAFAAAAKLPMPGQIGVSVDALTVGGTTIESLSGELNFDQTGWMLNGFQFHAPGMTEVKLSGRLTGTAQSFTFGGPATLASGDFETLLAWLDGRGSGGVPREAKAFSAQGEVTIASDRVAVERLTAALDQEKIAGRLGYNWPLDNRPARLDAELRAAQLDLDALLAFAKSAAGGEGIAPPQEATLALDIGRATFAGVDVQAVDAQVKFDAGKLQIDRLSIGDLAGAKLDMNGRIDELSSQPRGQMTLDLDAAALDGLGDIAAKLAPNAAASLRRVAHLLAPAKVHAVLNVERAPTSGSDAELHVNGTLAAMRIAIDGKAKGEPSHLGNSAVQIDGRIDADDGTALVALLSLDRVLAVDQLPGRLTLSAAGPLNGDIRVDGKIEASGFASAATGTLRLTGDRAPWGQLRLDATAGDLRPLHQAMTGQPSIAVPLTVHTALAVAGTKFSFTDLAATLGHDSVHGHVAVDWASPLTIDGGIEADEIDTASVFALLLGLPSNPQSEGAAGPSPPLGSGAFAAMNGTVNFKFDRADFTPALAARELTGVARFGPSAISVDGIDAAFAGGHITGALAFRRNADGLGVHAKVDLVDAAAATLVGPSMNVTDGRLTMTLSGDGFGASALGLIRSLQGGGRVTLKDARFAGLDPTAFDAARQAAGQNGPIEMAKVQTAVNTALANGHLDVPHGDAVIAIASGAINLDRVALQPNGGAQLAFAGSIDLGNASIDARMTLSEPPPASALIQMRPELSVAVKGPLTDPSRTLDISALNSWLTLSAAEMQTRRIQLIEADQQHDGSTAEAAHPDPPAVHLLSPGTVVESGVPPNLLSAPAPGTRSIERLKPTAPPPAAPEPKPPGPGSAEKGAAPAVPAPMAIRSSDQPALGARDSTATAGAGEKSRRPSVPLSAGPSSPPAD